MSKCLRCDYETPLIGTEEDAVKFMVDHYFEDHPTVSLKELLP